MRKLTGVHTPVSCTESIGVQREPGELKHLSSRRRRKKRSISKVAASEMERAQTKVRALWGSELHWAFTPDDSMTIVEWFWEDQPERVKVP